MAMAPEPVPMSAILRGWFAGRRFQDGFDEVLGFGAWDEDGGRDVEGEAVELLLAGDVLDGFVVQAARDGLFRRRCVGGGEFAVGMGDEGDAGDLQGVEEEEFGVAIGSGVEVRVAGELCCGYGEGFAECHGGQRVLLASDQVSEFQG